MSVREHPFATMAAIVTTGIDDGGEARRLELQEQRFVSLVENRRGIKKTNPARTLIAGVALAAAAIIAVALLWPTSSSEMPFTIGRNAEPGMPGAWISTNRGGRTDIRFSQGSLFRVEEDSAARVVTADTQNVAIELMRGVVNASVTGNQHTQWQVSAGPFTVTVLGTEFSVRWQANAEELEVNVSHGIVLVQGKGLSSHGVRLTAGSRLTTSERGRSWEVTSTDMPNDGLPASEVDRQPTIEPVLKPAETDDSNSETGKRTAATPRKKEIATIGKEAFSACRSKQYDACVASARRMGQDAFVAAARADDLWLLSEAARNTGDHPLSDQALIALRTGYRNTQRGRLAAFILGRSAMDTGNSQQTAIGWFETYLRESPRGNMAEEAHLRLMTLYRRNGRNDLAAAIAQSYLERFPSGTYENQARGILNSSR